MGKEFTECFWFYFARLLFTAAGSNTQGWHEWSGKKERTIGSGIFLN